MESITLSDGTTARVGASVHLVNQIGREASQLPRSFLGQTGTVQHINDNERVLVQFPRRQWRVEASSLAALVPLPDIDHTDLADLQRIVRRKTTCIIHEGMLYQATEKATPKGVMGVLLQQMTSEFQAIREQLARRSQQLTEERQRLVSMPQVSLAQIERHKVQLYQSDHIVHYLLPFVYAPIRIGTGRAFHNILPEKAAILKRELFVDIASDGHVVLRDTSLRRFHHYHAMGSLDCLGSIHVPQPLDLNSAVAFRDLYQAELETINGASLANRHPSGLPYFGELADCASAEQPWAWTTEEEHGNTIPTTATT